ncbi:DOMON domain containing protein [Plasmodiophora brassicae]
MSMIGTVWVVVVALACVGVHGTIYVPPPGPQSVNGSVTVTGRWRCGWTTDAANNVVELALTLLEPGTRGWIAVGLTKDNPTSGHMMTDSLIGWVDHIGTPNVFDQFSHAYQQPDLDVNVGGQDNVALVSGHINPDNTTTIVMRRRLVTGDAATDIDIVAGTTTNMLWAYGVDIPVVNQGPPLTLTYNMHGDNSQGIIPIDLFAAGDTVVAPGQTVTNPTNNGTQMSTAAPAMKSNALVSSCVIANVVLALLGATVAIW